MKHRSTRDAVEDLGKGGYLIQIDEEVNARAARGGELAKYL